MARLQKKKSVSRKAIKTTKAADQISPVEGVAAGKEGSVSSTSLKGSQKMKGAVPKKAPVTSRVAAKGKDNPFFDKWLHFLKEVKVELKKVTWPSRKQTVASTAVVIVLVVVLSVFLGVVDAGLSGLVRVVLN